MKFSIVTPTYRQLDWLALCVASVKAQACPAGERPGAYQIEHIVQDGGTPGIEEFSAARRTECQLEALSESETLSPISDLQDQNYSLRVRSGPDTGMYDALNKGFSGGAGEICAWLNSDEQYLPGALSRVHDYFLTNPEIDLTFGHVLLLSASGGLISFRKAYPLRKAYVLADHFYLLSAGMFFRRRLLDSGMQFDTRFRYAGDADLVVRMLEAGARPGYLNCFTSTFTMTGNNLGAEDAAVSERIRLRKRLSPLLRSLYPVLTPMRRIEKLIHGTYTYDGPASYEVFVTPGQTKIFPVQAPSSRWPDPVKKTS